MADNHELPAASPHGPRAAWVAALCLLASALMLPLDAPLSVWAQGLPEPVRAAFGVITTFGLAELYLIPTVLLGLACYALAWLPRQAASRPALLRLGGLNAYLALSLGLPVALAWIVKRLVGRARPELIESAGPFSLSGFSLDWAHHSFPSSHSLTAFAMALAVSLLRPRWRLPAFTLAVLVGLSRIVLGAHYPSDVVAGAGLGLLGVVLARPVSSHWLRCPSNSQVIAVPKSRSE